MLGKSALVALAAIALGAAPSGAVAAPQRQVHVTLPSSPKLVAVGAGVQVVAGCGEDLFVASGWWWLRRRGAWYRAAGPRLPFVHVETARVPLTVVAIPPGRYRGVGEADARPAGRSPEAAAPRGDPLAGGPGVGH